MSKIGSGSAGPEWRSESGKMIGIGIRIDNTDSCTRDESVYLMVRTRKNLTLRWTQMIIDKNRSAEVGGIGTPYRTPITTNPWWWTPFYLLIMLPYCINSISFSAYSTLDHFEVKKFGQRYADFYVQDWIWICRPWMAIRIRQTDAYPIRSGSGWMDNTNTVDVKEIVAFTSWCGRESPGRCPWTWGVRRRTCRTVCPAPPPGSSSSRTCAYPPPARCTPSQ